MPEESPPVCRPSFGPPDPVFLVVLALVIPALLVQAALNEAKELRRGDFALFWFVLGVGVAGCILLIAARWPLYRKRMFTSFGAMDLPKRSRVLYRLAYGFIIPAICALLLIWVTVR